MANRLNARKKFYFGILFLSCFVVTAGCRDRIDIEKAKKFGETAIKFEQGYEEIITDIYASCMRAARFVLPAIRRSQVEDSCLEFGDAQDELLQQHNFLKSYTSSLRKLSSDEIIDNLDGAGELAGALTSLPIPGLAEVSAPISPIIKRIAIAIQQSLEDDFRRKVIQKNVDLVNQDIQALIARLSRTTELVYTDRLNNEAAVMNSYYASGVDQEFCNFAPGEFNGSCLATTNSLQLTAYLVDQQWQEAKESAKINEKLNKLEIYIDNLKNMAIQHQALFDSIE